ncbi:hypothetical protein F4781DRAFT_297126 [Annulohypoxylon bovei var. microspora]|nr:hypothetical protein F4781DRAFT_297126 [Annulohypoxylon bovei var. microspora]
MAPLIQNTGYQCDKSPLPQGVNRSLVPPVSELKTARLCANCSGAMFHDGRDGFKEKLAGDKPPRLLFPVKSYHDSYRKIWTDTIPGLPQIEKSSLQGCGFCSFLRSSILSRDADDILLRDIGKRQVELDTCNVSISVAYCWSSGPPDIYRDIHNGDHIEKEAYSRQEIFSDQDGLNKEYIENDANILNKGSPRGHEHNSIDLYPNTKVDDGQLEGLLIRLDVHSTDEYIPPFYFCCYATQAPGTLEGSEATGNWLGLALPSSQDYSEPHRMDWMRRALRKCEAHDHQVLDKKFTPERLIDVRPTSPRLVLRNKYHTSQTGSHIPTYAALSYCWGPPEDAKSQLTTTEETFEERQKGIDCHKMTQVLKMRFL